MFEFSLGDLRLSTDPLSQNRYALAGGNPVSNVEIDGHMVAADGHRRWCPHHSLGHGALDVAGLVPVIGEQADLANAAWYEAEGDHVNAALSAASAVPLLGYGAKRGEGGQVRQEGRRRCRDGPRRHDGGPDGQQVLFLRWPDPGGDGRRVTQGDLEGPGR